MKYSARRKKWITLCHLAAWFFNPLVALFAVVASSSAAPQLDASTRPQELPPTAVIDAWLKTGSTTKYGAADVQEIASWLRRIMAHPHRRVDASTIKGFEESIKTFCEHSGADFSSPLAQQESVDLMRFCCEQVWAIEADTPPGDSLKQYEKLSQDILNEVKDQIDATLPDDKKAQWEPKVNDMIGGVKSQIDEKIRQLNADFLFPGFKRPVTDAEASQYKSDVDQWGLTPKYGQIEEAMQTRDEAFDWQLQRFKDNFGMFYIYSQSFSQLAAMKNESQFWAKYTVKSGPRDGMWPMFFGLDAPTNQSVLRRPHG